jgi:GT2 family glycosyltransferase
VQPFAFGDDPSLLYIIRRALSRVILRRPLHDWATATPQQVDWVAGTCLLARTAAVRSIGGWDAGFFMYFEDNDLCRRLRGAGCKVWYDPSVAAVHLGGQADYGDVRRRLVYYRSLLRYQRKHMGLASWLLLSIVLRPYIWLLSRREKR